MEYLKLEVKDQIAHMQLNRGSSNALHYPMLEELSDSLAAIQGNAAIGGLILHGTPGFFSSGVDLITLYQYNEEDIRRFWLKLLDVVKLFIAFDKPAVAAISGHSPAGGCILALCCDYRLMAEGDFIIGLNEVPLGIIVPHRIFRLYSFWIGQSKAYRYLLEGGLFKPEEAKKRGLIDDVVEPNRLVISAEKQVKKYLSFNWETWRQTKVNLRRELAQVFEQEATEEVEQVLKQWWAPETRAILKTVIENFKRKS